MKPRAKLRAARAEVERFLTSRGPTLVFVGALTVFLTYVTKEGIADYWKRTVSAVGDAEEDFRRTGLTIEMLRRMDGIANTLERIELPSHGLNAEVRLEEERINATAIAQQLAIAEQLLTRLGLLDSEEAAGVAAVKEQAKTYGASIRTAAERLSIESDPVSLGSAMMPLTLAGMAVEQHAGDVIGAVRRRALEEKERSARNLSIARWLSYFLYTAGWALGLAGKVYGRASDLAPA